MRLLQRSADGDFGLTQVRDDAIPPYAILSHTWGADAEEVTFDDLTKGIGKKKHGYKKIYFCAEQAARDGLEYFWIDTCCINKANKAELSHAINSMFRWYRNATRCYVYLTDVTGCCIDDDFHLQWDSVLGRSRWFTRGWTLQELLAPRSIEFFSCEGIRIGDRSSLKEQIQHITGVPASAFQGAHLSQFSADERFLWMERRETKLPEDKVYSLLGILDIEIPLYYGEGAGNASNRVREMIDKRERCIQDLRLTDPRDDKKRIEDTKGGLLEDSYHWILENVDFQQWRDDENNRLLWIKGDPGKGKTMLLCGIINELKKSIAKTDLLSYFFCQATDRRINSATAVLRGLLYLLVKQQPSLVSHIQKKHDHAGNALFEDANAWVALSEIFTSILRDPSVNRTFLIVDALDECVTDLPKLLDFVAQKSCVSSRAKWIVSSRNWSNIEERLEMAGQKVRLCLELNAESVAAAVSIFIKHKVLQLAQWKKYNDKTRDAVLNHLSSNADDTFLWVALVCQSLKETPRYNTLAKLNAFPPGLDSLYERMMQQICASDSADLSRQILALIAIVYRPITLLELVALVESLDDMADDLESVREIISLCGSFLTNRGDTVYFVHQSAKDFLFAKAASEIFPSGIEAAHYAVFSRSLKVMSTLQRDMYSLRELGYPAELVEPPDLDLLAALRYSCIYWIDHLSNGSLASAATSSVDLQDSGAVYEFLREKYLYWLEALSLCKSLSKGIVSIAKLKALVDGREDAAMLNELVQDAHRFIMAHKGAIENSPLQAYASALLFSPASSLVRGHFKEEEPQWITIKPSNVTGDQWSACLSTLEGHSNSVWSVAFSHDSARLASASADKTVKIWDRSSGACLSTLEGHSGSVRSVAFSHDSARLASASDDKTVKIWDWSSGACLSTLEGHSSSVRSVAFSHDSAWLASASYDKTVKIWDWSSGACLSTLEGHSNSAVMSVAFSHDSARLASASYDKTVKIWDLSSGACLSTLEGHSSSVESVAFSHDSARLASASDDKTVKIWDPSSGACLQTLNVGQTLYRISFDRTDSYLDTEIGTISLRNPSDSIVPLNNAEVQQPQYKGIALSSDGVWITYNSKIFIWLPLEYRPSCSAVLDNTISVGVGSGRVWFASTS
ncbi:WD40 repeat-like protein [Byssothecium circinans]|uniref:WD40 repeat-like protein n=1 Tax=Byssothecium circinans TaxID=147558 RepID=A0A6A5TS81_9PLEO|nr:WD40 repeat-like protein [Byssothecium circinans]